MKFDGDTVSAAPEVDARELDGTTRQRVLQLVVEKGPISAAQLGRELSLTAAAVRRHLDAMTEQGVVEIKTVSSRRKGAGRPSRRYVLSSRGQQELGDDYLNLVRTALAVMDERDEGRAAQSLAKSYFAEFEQRYAPELEHVADLDERTERLSALFSADGFAGFTRLVGRDNPLLAMQSTQLCQGHCPVREIAAAHPVFCEEETAMIARLLDVDVRRLSTQAAGAHVCTTHVPVGRERLAAERAARAREGTSETSQAGRTAGRKRIVISPRQQERLS
ncbi:helix-turn-helix transcriptional regulator [Nesterenkonia natronophila]|uniref:Winged helix-turn-helix transcriptional regulator n=1 Tax=Nesterenkonia natronophila TaxID=2174932 RepID=A0A3A4F0I1_9MICC|nr:helix-turn-helix domain-containing protein [Nesterenkonia natronophila]RJN31211.1 winged helix-turn-helix transcriptional regulator [Nesterenkonia natronophila]